jgi:hypothetical protein
MGIWSLLADVVFVGHSLVGPTLPALVEAALKQLGTPSVVQAQIINGASLAYNWDHGAGAEGIDARARLSERATDVLILTEAQPFAGHVKYSFTAQNVAKFAALAVESNPDTRVYLYETWPSLNSAPGAVVPGDPEAGTPWRERLALELPLWQGVVSQARALSGHDVALIPAGQAMGRLADAIRDGAVPGIATIQDMFVDDIHPNGKGLYFLAMLHAGAISGQTPVGLPAKLTRAWASRDAVISDEQAQVLQQIAWDALQSYVPAEGRVAAKPAPAPVAPPSVAAPAVPSIDPPFPAFAPITNQHLAMNLAGINDWSVQQPFLNVMKTARPWVGHLPGQWGGWTHDDLARAGALSPDGWPLRLPAELTGIATLILTDLPEDALGVAGRYILTYQGNGTLRLDGRAAVVLAEPGRILFDYTPGEGTVLITLTAIDPADPIRDIVVVREARAQALAYGAIFNPDWLARVRGVKGLRFMDWMATNDSTLSNPADRPKPADYTYARIGAPAEVLVALANDLAADPWLTLPHLATDDFARTYAQIVHDGLDAGLKAHVEYSNEVWNWQFAQARWAEEQGRARWGKESTWVQFYAMRAAEIMGVWGRVFQDAPDRLVRVVAVQTGWLGLEEQILDAPLLVAEGRSPPVDSFDAYAVTGYFSALIGSDQKFVAVKDWLKQSADAARNEAALQGLSGAQADAHFAAHRFDLAVKLAAAELRDGSVTGDPTDSLAFVRSQILPYHAAIAADRGLRLMMYEGGTHVVGIGSQSEDEELTAFFTHLNYSPEMGALYAELLAGWQLQSDAPFNAFVDVNRANKWGSFGVLRHLGDDNPRWQALAKGCLTC